MGVAGRGPKPLRDATRTHGSARDHAAGMDSPPAYGKAWPLIDHRSTAAALTAQGQPSPDQRRPLGSVRPSIIAPGRGCQDGGAETPRVPRPQQPPARDQHQLASQVPRHRPPRHRHPARRGGRLMVGIWEREDSAKRPRRQDASHATEQELRKPAGQRPDPLSGLAARAGMRARAARGRPNLPTLPCAIRTTWSAGVPPAPAPRRPARRAGRTGPPARGARPPRRTP